MIVVFTPLLACRINCRVCLSFLMEPVGLSGGPVLLRNLPFGLRPGDLLSGVEPQGPPWLPTQIVWPSVAIFGNHVRFNWDNVPYKLSYQFLRESSLGWNTTEDWILWWLMPVLLLIPIFESTDFCTLHMFESVLMRLITKTNWISWQLISVLLLKPTFKRTDLCTL